MPNVITISAKINTMQNINILLFVRSFAINHQHSEKLTRWIEATWTRNT